MIEQLSRRFVKLCFALALLACAAAPASADPLAITAGTFSGCPSCVDELHGGTFFGGGFSFTGSSETMVAQQFVNTGGIVNGSSSNSFRGAGIYRGITDGVTYYVARESFLRFTTADVMLPAGPALTTLEIVVPFTLSGRLLLTDDIGRFHPPTFSFEVSGEGLARITLTPFFPGATGYRVANIRYDFAAPAAVPEPATVTLLGAGLAATLLRRRRRRRAARRGTRT